MNGLRFGLSLIAVFAVACSDESKVKDAAVEASEARLEKTVKTEADEKITGKDAMVKIYVRAVMGRSEFEVDNFTITSPSATAFVKVRTLPKSVRIALVDIIARLDKSKENAFNVSEALKATLTVMNMSQDERIEYKDRIELRDQDGWQALPAAP